MIEELEKTLIAFIQQANIEMMQSEDDPIHEVLVQYENPLLMIVPVRYTFDHSDPQKEMIDTCWNNFCSNGNMNKVAVVESGLRSVAKNEQESFENEGGEGGYLTYIADKSVIGCVCYEPTKQEIYTQASKYYSMDDVYYATLMDSVYQYSNEETTTSVEEYIQHFIDSFNDEANTDYSLTDLSRIHQKNWSKPLDLSDWQTAYTVSNPYGDTNPVKELQQFVVTQRDVQILKKIIEAHKNGVTQFALYGQSHCWIYSRVLNRYFCSQNMVY
jgi:hypothetical protein